MLSLALSWHPVSLNSRNSWGRSTSWWITSAVSGRSRYETWSCDCIMARKSFSQPKICWTRGTWRYRISYQTQSSFIKMLVYFNFFILKFCPPFDGGADGITFCVLYYCIAFKNSNPASCTRLGFSFTCHWMSPETEKGSNWTFVFSSLYSTTWSFYPHQRCYVLHCY